MCLNGANKETIVVVAAAKLLNATTKAFHFSPPPAPAPAQQNKNLKSFINFDNLTISANIAAPPSGQKLQQSVAVVNNGLSALSTKTTADSKKSIKFGSMAAIASTPILHVGGGGAIDAGIKMATDCEMVNLYWNWHVPKMVKEVVGCQCNVNPCDHHLQLHQQSHPRLLHHYNNNNNGYSN